MSALTPKAADDGIKAEAFRAPVKVWLLPATWRTLSRLAEINHTTIGELLSNLADNATDPTKHERTGVRRWKRSTPDQVTALHALRAADSTMSIRVAAERVGLTYATAYRILTTNRPEGTR